MHKILIILFFVLFSCEAVAQELLHLNKEIFYKINRIRNNNGLVTLKINQKLNLAADSQSDWMSQVRRMDHLRKMPDSFDKYKTCSYHPVNRVVKSGYYKFEDLFNTNYRNNHIVFEPKDIAKKNIGEIIAMSKAMDQSYNTNIIVTGWMNSPGHRKAILTPHYREMGIGISSPRYGEVYWCVVFATH